LERTPWKAEPNASGAQPCSCLVAGNALAYLGKRLELGTPVLGHDSRLAPVVWIADLSGVGSRAMGFRAGGWDLAAQRWFPGGFGPSVRNLVTTRGMGLATLPTPGRAPTPTDLLGASSSGRGRLGSDWARGPGLLAP